MNNSNESEENLVNQFNPENQEKQERKGTERFIERLSLLNEGDIGLLRSHSGSNLDKSLEGFDMFTGIWWYLRQNGWAPKRRVSWLITKLYAQFPFPQESEFTLAKHLSYCAPKDFDDHLRFQSRFDQILLSQFTQLEPHLLWALSTIRQNSSGEIKFDWVQLTNDLWKWDNDDTKIKWAEEFLNYRTNLF